MPAKPRAERVAARRGGSRETWETPREQLPTEAEGGVRLCPECRLYRPVEAFAGARRKTFDTCSTCRGGDPLPGSDDAADAARIADEEAARAKATKPKGRRR